MTIASSARDTCNAIRSTGVEGISAMTIQKSKRKKMKKILKNIKKVTNCAALAVIAWMAVMGIVMIYIFGGLPLQMARVASILAAIMLLTKPKKGLVWK